MLVDANIAFDASTPAAPSHTGTTTPLVTASYSPPAKSLVLAMAGAGWSNTAGVTMACSDSGSHSWTNPVNAIGTVAGNGGGVALFYTYFASAPGSITTSIAYGGSFSTGGGSFLDLLVFTGAAASQALAAVGSFVASTNVGTTTGTVGVTTTAPNSWVWGMSDSTTSNTTYTVNGNTVVDSTDSNGTTDAITLVGWHGNGTTGVPGLTTFGGTWGSNQVANIAAMEILPANLWVPPSLIMSQSIQRSNFY